MGYRVLTIEQLEKLSDKNLLALYKKVRKVNFDRVKPSYNEHYDFDIFIEDDKYQSLVKSVLEKRSHVPRPGVNINHKTRNKF